MRQKTFEELASGLTREELENYKLQKEMYTALIDELKDIKKSREINRIILIGNFVFSAINIVVLIMSVVYMTK